MVVSKDDRTVLDPFMDESLKHFSGSVRDNLSSNLPVFSIFHSYDNLFLIYPGRVLLFSAVVHESPLSAEIRLIDLNNAFQFFSVQEIDGLAIPV